MWAAVNIRPRLAKTIFRHGCSHWGEMDVSRAVIISDIPADQIETIAQLHHYAGAAIRIADRGRGVYSLTAKYPDPPIAALDPTVSPQGYSIGQAVPSWAVPAGGPFDPNHPGGDPENAVPRTGVVPPGISRKGVALIKTFEGCLTPDGAGNFVPYRCPAGILTIGWGHTNIHGRLFNELSVWSKQECDEAFVEDMRYFCSAVQTSVTVSLNQNQFDALVSFAYNCGTVVVARSALLKKLNEHDYTGAAAEFIRWNKGGGVVLQALVRRRAAEMELFMSAPSVSFALGSHMSRDVSAS
jgi:lysozyme